MQKLISLAFESGAGYSDIRYGKVTQKNIISLDGKIVRESNCINSGYGIRMLSEGIITFASTPDFNYAEREIKKATKISSQISKWKKGIASLAETSVTEASVSRKAKVNWQEYDKNEILEDIKNLNEYIKENIKVKSKIETDILLFDWSEQFINSEGSKIFQEYPYAILTLTGRVKHNDSEVKYYQPFGGMGGIEVLPFNKHDQLSKFIEVINNLPSAKIMKPGKHKSVLSEDMAWTLVPWGHVLSLDTLMRFSIAWLARCISWPTCLEVNSGSFETALFLRM